MASNPPPFLVEDDTDEDFFDRLVNDDDDVDFKVNRPLTAIGPSTNQIESDETSAFANLTINESGNEGKIIFDSTVGGNNDKIDEDTSRVETVEEIENPSKSENGEAEVSDVTIVGKNTDEGFSDLTMLSKTSSGSGVSGVKEVDWNVFHADSSQNDNVFGSFDFEFGAENAGDAFGNMVGNISNNVSQVAIGNSLHESSYADNSVNYGQHQNVGYDDGIAADQSSIMQGLSSNQSWEDEYPGWKYDPSTGQWYQVDSYVPGSSVQSNLDSNISSIQGVAEFSYMQKAAESVAHAVSEAGTTESVSNWNQAPKVSDAAETATNWTQVSQVSSDGNNGYPPHMVFDPQYPGWYYDTINQNWCTLESYTTSGLSSAVVQDGMNQDAYALTDAFSQNVSPQESIIHGQGNSYNSQGLHQSWGGSVSNYNQKKSSMWLPESVSSSEATSPYIGKQVAVNNYGQDVSVSTHGSKQNSVHFEVNGSHYENASLGQNEFSMPSQFLGDVKLSQHVSNNIVGQNEQKHFSSDYYKDHKPLNFQQQPIQNAQMPFTPASGRSSAGRPAHALVAFGFGGKLVVMKHNNSTENMDFGSQDPVGGSISVLNLAELVNGNIDTLNHGMGVRNYFQALCRQPVPGPLTSGSVGSKDLNKWIDERITNLMSNDMDYRNADALRLLLSLLKIACQSYGKLRSPYGTDAVLKENEALESAVAKLFASAKTNGSQFSQYGAVANCMQQLPSEGQLRVAAAEVQNLLVSGRKKDALQRAQEGQLWGPALVLASQLGHQFYAETVKQMALRQLIPGSPLRTLCLLIAGQPADAFSPDSSPITSMAGAINTSQQPVQFGANVMLDNWEENLAVITANRTKGDELVLVHLGDCLWKERSDIIAAHICYLIAEASFEPYSDSARMCLLGADHWKFPRTYATPEAIQRTEIYEYSKMLGNSQFVLFPFQPYKFVYALMLAEVGRISEALKYCQAVLKSLKTGRTPEMETLRHLVSSLEERIKGHQQGGFSTKAPKEFIGKLLNLLDNTAHRVVGGLPPSAPTTVGTVHDNGNQYQSSGPRESTSQSSPFTPSLVPSSTSHSSMFTPSLVPSSTSQSSMFTPSLVPSSTSQSSMFTPSLVPSSTIQSSMFTPSLVPSSTSQSSMFTPSLVPSSTSQSSMFTPSLVPSSTIQSSMFTPSLVPSSTSQSSMFTPSLVPSSTSQSSMFTPSLVPSSTIQSSMFIPSLVPSQSMEPISELTADRNKMTMQTRSVSESDIWKSPVQSVQADTSNEASSTELQDKTSAAGAKSRFGRFGFGSQLLQKTVSLVLKPRQGKQAKLGESNKFYYDEKLKRWVEEGAEAPAEEAALPPPPPTTAVFQNGTPEYHLKNALQTEAFLSNGSPEFKSSSSSDNSSGMPPIPPASNQYSARGRMGVRSRYVDTFNKGGGNGTSAFQPPSAPTVKLASGGNPKFFVPAPVSTAEQAVDTPVNDEQYPYKQNPSSTDESSSTSPLNDSFQPNAPPPLTMQRFASMKNISNKELNDNGTFSTHSRRTASWSGSLNGSFSPPLNTPSGGVLGVYSSPPSDPSLVHSSVSGGSFGDGLHEVEF